MSDDKAFNLNKDLIVTNKGYYDKFTWNAAIEKAMNQFIDSQLYCGYDAYKIIRGLKK